MQQLEIFLKQHNIYSIESFLITALVLILTICYFFIKRYAEESGKQKAEIESLNERLRLQHVYNINLEREKESIKHENSCQIENARLKNLEQIEHIKQKHSLEIEEIKNKNTAQLEQNKQENIKRKLQYETKQKEFREFTNLLSLINFDNHNFLVDTIGQTMMDYQAAYISGNKSKADELIIKFNQVAYEFSNIQKKNLGKIHSQTNGILLATSSQKIRDSLKNLSDRITQAEKSSDEYLQLIAAGQVDIQKTGKFFEEKFMQNGTNIKNARDKLIDLMREELDNI